MLARGVCQKVAKGVAAAMVSASMLSLWEQPLSAQQPPAAGVARPLSSRVRELVDEVVTADIELEITKRRSKVLRMKQDVFRAAVADPSIVEFVAFGTREIEMIGKETGSTSVTLWIGDEQNSRTLSLLVTVKKDDAVDDQRRLEYGELERMINELFPNSRIQLVPIADKLIVRGQARDEQEATEIMSILRERGSTGANSGGGGNFSTVSSGASAAEPFPDASTLPQASVINMLNVPGEKQVMLKVRIAELKRSALRELGSDFDFNVKEFLFGSVLSGGGNLLASGTFSEGGFNLVLSALMTNGSAKILAEPNLVVISGQTATFLAGGEFAVPTVVGIGGAQAATTQFKGFGTQVIFTPTVLDKDRVRLQVAPSFSTINRNNAVQGIFGTDTRSVATTVDLREGQVLAIAGLLQEEQRGESRRLPLIGDVPYLNFLSAYRSMTRDETELLILVSPELVHPLEPDQAPQILPGMEVTEPNDLDFFIYGDIEGRADCHHRSTVWPLYRSKMKRCGNFEQHKIRQSDEYYISGPFGFSQ